MSTQLPPSKAYAFVIAARTSSIVSVIGSIVILTTFIFFPFFRKPINRLVFFATFGNLLTNVATLMSTSVLPEPGQIPSAICEAQGLLIQWFMIADAFWILCMATNVLLVFFYGYDALQLRHLEKWYFLFSYGIPAIPTLTYIGLARAGHKIIDSATLWCWVSTDAEWMRIAFFYVPAWILISASIVIYSVAGYRIWKKSIELHSVSRGSSHLSTMRLTSRVRGGTVDEFSKANSILVTTQIECDIQQQDAAYQSNSADLERLSIRSCASTQMLPKAADTEDLISSPVFCPSPTITTGMRLGDVESQLNLHQVPVGQSGYRATIVSTSRPVTATQEPVILSTPPRPTGKRTPESHAAAMAYFQVAFLMFLALVVVWLPSSINRMYQFVHRDRPNFALNLLSAIVLPLQGAWNAVIYIFTTRAECRRAWSILVRKFTDRPLLYQPKQECNRKGAMSSSQVTRDSAPDVDMDEIFKQDTQKRHVEAARSDNARRGDCRGKQVSS